MLTHLSGNRSGTGRASGVTVCWYTSADNELKTGSSGQPRRRTPRAVGSMRKCLTPPAPPARTAKPNAPGNELESRTMNAPSSSCSSADTAMDNNYFCRDHSQT